MEQQSEELKLLGILGQSKTYDGELNNHGTVEYWEYSSVYARRHISTSSHFYEPRATTHKMDPCLLFISPYTQELMVSYGINQEKITTDDLRINKILEREKRLRSSPTENICGIQTTAPANILKGKFMSKKYSSVEKGS